MLLRVQGWRAVFFYYYYKKKFSHLDASFSQESSFQGTCVCLQIVLLSKSKEFSDIQLRMSEKRPLNTLNRDKNMVTIRSDV